MGKHIPLTVAVDATVLGSGRGGDETLLRGLLTGLAQVAPGRGHASFPLFLRAGATPPAAVIDRADFPVHRLTETSRVARYVIQLPRALGSVTPSPDLVYTQTHAAPVSDVPSVLQLTDLSFRHHPEFYPALTRLRLNLLVPFQARRARAVFVISEFTRRDVIASLHVSPERVFVVPCAIEPRPDTDQTPGELAGWLAELGIRQPFVLYVGNLHPRKNLRRLIQAFDAARRANDELGHDQLVLVGTEHNFYPRLWQSGEAASLRTAGQTNGIIALGHVPDSTRDRLMRAARLLAYPSLFEGFGLPPVEAMAVGTPVLAANTSALPEVLGDAALLVDPYNVDAIAQGLIRLATDAGLRRLLKERGCARAARYATRVSGACALDSFERALTLPAPSGLGTSALTRLGASAMTRLSASQSRSIPGSSPIKFRRRPNKFNSFLTTADDQPIPTASYNAVGVPGKQIGAPAGPRRGEAST